MILDSVADVAVVAVVELGWGRVDDGAMGTLVIHMNFMFFFMFISHLFS